MTDRTAFNALLHSGFRSVDEIWGFEIGRGMVSQFPNQTLISFSILDALPYYYFGEPEAEVVGSTDPEIEIEPIQAFVPIEEGSALASGIERMLGFATSVPYSAEFTDVAKVTFAELP